MHVMKYFNKVPYSTLQLTQVKKGDWYININGEPIHHIKSMLAFYRTMGYPEIPVNIFEKKENYEKDEIFLNEYIQAMFRCEAAVEDYNCLKYKITEYLIKHSEAFKITYGDI